MNVSYQKEGSVGYLSEMAQAGYNPGSISTFHRVMIPYPSRELDVRQNELVVDLGAAQGHCIISAKVAGYNRLAVVDIDPYDFKLFESSFGIACYRCDAEQDRLPFADSQVRLILNFHLIEHLRDPGNFLCEAMRVLETGGILAVVTSDWRKQYKSFWRDHTHVHPYDKEGIARLLRIYGFAGAVRSWNARHGAG